MRLEKCYFCGGTVYPGHGIMFVRNDSKIFRFCRSKCHTHFKMKHNPRKTKWTKAFRKLAGKEMTVDKTFDFEKKRNRPVKYDRDLVSATIKVMKRLDVIRERRKRAFYKNRMQGVRAREKMMQLKEIDQHIDIIRAPSALLKMKAKILENKNKIQSMETELGPLNPKPIKKSKPTASE
ncbi:ribosomal protein L24-like protein [Cavenderia fasciculata]|uniref:Ribosomal protein L24-like protein n=1 Tax=Cavenderia fasciculata TaxID=261658 RepID=F4PHX3_CACFS|nr:ribosomal protein L24-like protein [Cavenderia fasciculata]EGG25307.1 ribosomal protein L24-like protein [Cavenderia fasciculata]|eukprot:XP_004363158.1 ribosomal protein L24-like protein [Cavenderia fasciculata]